MSLAAPLRWTRHVTDLVRGGSATISPTAYYTGHVWARNGLGDPGLTTTAGRALFLAGQPVLVPVDLLGGPTLEHFLLARHRIIDRLLDHEIRAGRVGAVVELAAGMSPRGLRFVREHDEVEYVEVDLPAIAEQKREALARLGTPSVRHRVAAADVFGDEFPALFHGLDAGRGVAVVSEGLLNYFPTDRVELLWGRIASELRRFPTGLYLSDLHLRGGAPLVDRAFATALGVFVRGRVHFHYEHAAAAEATLVAAGFDSAQLHAPAEYAEELPGMCAAGADRVRVVEARTE
jgi:O-methyltransferase involved in polyketide biosynthesis